tara:strand:- start:10497 stop:10862 length:366 start_codon:yes stop_codon:yes gene_type:complete
MAKKKKSSGKKYVSKGQRPNVTRATKNAMKRERVTSPESLLQSLTIRNRIKFKPQNKQEKELSEKYFKEDDIAIKARQLFYKYQGCGVTWAACVQAVKTDYVELFQKKWNGKLAAYRKANA